LATAARCGASASKRGGELQSVVMSLIRGNLSSDGTKVSGQPSNTIGRNMPTKAAPAPVKPLRQMPISDNRPSAMASAKPTTQMANRLIAAGVGNDVSRCSRTPVTVSPAENKAMRPDQDASREWFLCPWSIIALPSANLGS